MNLKRIVNSDIKIAGGVLAGVAYYFKIPSWIVRLAFCITALVTGIFILSGIYLALWAFLPKLNVTVEEFDMVTGEKEREELKDNAITDVNFREMNRDGFPRDPKV